MESKFNFYDFIGYIIPGAFIFILLFWFLFAFFSFELPFKVISIGGSILFLFFSYFLGHLVQSLGNIVEKKLLEKWGGWFSEQFLRDDNNYYTCEFKNKLKKITCELFGFSYNGSSNDEEQKKRREQIFNLCYSLIVQKNVALHTEIFNGIYGLYRGILIVWDVGIIISFLITLKHLMWLFFLVQDIEPPIGPFWRFENFQLILGIIFLFFFIFSHSTLESRLKRFSQRFVDSVYRNFYVWYISRE